MSEDDEMSDKEFELLAKAVAGAVGLDSSDILDAVAATNQKSDKRQAKALRVAEQDVRKRGLHRRLISEYYKDKGSSGLGQYALVLDGALYPTTVFTTSNRVGLACDLSEIETAYVNATVDPQYTPRAVDHLKGFRPHVLQKLKLLNVKLDDNAMYRLVSDPFAGDDLTLSFSASRYFEYRFTTGLLEDELVGALANNPYHSLIYQNRLSTLPLRNAMLPNVESFRRYNGRIVAGGISGILAIARRAPERDFVIPLQIRSAKVAEGRGTYTGSIQAWHQPLLGQDDEEVKPYWTVLREIAEELFDVKEVEQRTRHLSHDWFLDKCPGVRFLHDNAASVKLKVLGIGINALIGTYDLAVLVVVEDERYYDKYMRKMITNWEAETNRKLFTSAPAGTLATIFSSGWFDQGMFGLSQALKYLREHYPDRVAEPGLDYVLT
jgi:hypothetical protein